MPKAKTKKEKKNTGIVNLGDIGDKDGDDDDTPVKYAVSFDPYNLYVYRNSP